MRSKCATSLSLLSLASSCCSTLSALVRSFHGCTLDTAYALGTGANTIRGAVFGNTMINVTVSNNKVCLATSYLSVYKSLDHHGLMYLLPTAVLPCCGDCGRSHRLHARSRARCLLACLSPPEFPRVLSPPWVDALLKAMYGTTELSSEVRAMPLSDHIKVSARALDSCSAMPALPCLPHCDLLCLASLPCLLALLPCPLPYLDPCPALPCPLPLLDPCPAPTMAEGYNDEVHCARGCLNRHWAHLCPGSRAAAATAAIAGAAAASY